MQTDVVATATVDSQIAQQASDIYAAAGLTVSDALRLMLMRTVEEQALPFDPMLPNADTVDAMLAARRGELTRVGSIEGLFKHLHSED